MSIRRNIVANYVGQIYVAVVNLAPIPLYLRYMGAEAYGLVGFFSVIQTWFQMLDLGMNATLGREMARFRGGALTNLELRRLLRAMEMLFFAVSLSGATILALLSPFIARRWLRVEQLGLSDVTCAVAMMGAGVALRWVSGIYRSAIVGLERQVWLNVYMVLSSTTRSLLVLPVLIYVSHSVTTFFGFQLLVSMLEVVVIAAQVYWFLPPCEEAIGWSLAPLRRVLRFSLAIAFAASAWVAATNTDKLVLSKVLPLRDFGFFTLAVLVASCVYFVGGPVSQALLPRLSALDATGDEGSLLLLYRRATQWVAIVTAPVTITLTLFAQPLLYAWTGVAEAAHQAAPILALYAVGNGTLAMAAFQYYLQYAKGSLRLHLIGNIGFVLVLVPSLVWVARRFGGVGAGVLWVTQCAFYLLGWTYIVHRRLAPGLHWRWLLRDVVPIWAAAVSAGAVTFLIYTRVCHPSAGRFAGIPAALVGGALSLLAGALASADIRFVLSQRRELRMLRRCVTR